MDKKFDVIVIGAGLSGIGAACHVARDCPDKSIAVLERRNAIGGTWDLFRYPGIRSDSDMFSFGFAFRPWHALKLLADGPSIREYVRDTAREFGIEEKVHFGLRTLSADWSSDAQRWTITTRHEASGETRRYVCRYLIGATGYYNYDAGHRPSFAGEDDFRGPIIHPQHWPEDLDYSGKRIVVIGSGATAVTLVPAMAGKAAHVTMLQRSPSYIFTLPAYDKLSELLQRVLPDRWVFAMARKRNIVVQRAIYIAARRWPNAVRKLLLNSVRKQLDGKIDMRHFTPSYQPWDERLCAVPEGDLFKALRDGSASVVTDEIARFTETGIALKSGEHLDADIIITATGLQVQVLGGTELRVDSKPLPVADLMTYKGVLMQDVPNMAWIFGYTNAPWTLKADIASSYVCRLLQHMDEHGYAVATPRAPAGVKEAEGNILDALQSGYIRRAADTLPRQGNALPWRVLHHYGRDRRMLLQEPIDDGFLQFEAPMDMSRQTARAA